MSTDADYEARKQRRLRALETDNPCCGTCPEDRWQALEIHHVAGQAYDADTTIILCRNCHRVASDAQREHPPKQASADAQLEMLGRFLLGLADLLRIAVEKLIAYGQYLIERASAASTAVQP